MPETEKMKVGKGAGRAANGQFLPGYAGGPGRPQGQSNSLLVKARQWVADKGLPMMIEAAESGDMDALKCLVTLGMPKVRPVNPALDCLEGMPLPKKTADLGNVAQFLVERVASGSLSVTDADAIYSLAERSVSAQSRGRAFQFEVI